MHIKKNQSSSNLFKRTVDSTDDFRPPRRGGGDVAPSVECLVTRTVYRCTHDIILKQKYVKIYVLSCCNINWRIDLSVLIVKVRAWHCACCIRCQRSSWRDRQTDYSLERCSTPNPFSPQFRCTPVQHTGIFSYTDLPQAPYCAAVALRQPSAGTYGRRRRWRRRSNWIIHGTEL